MAEWEDLGQGGRRATKESTKFKVSSIQLRYPKSERLEINAYFSLRDTYSSYGPSLLILLVLQDLLHVMLAEVGPVMVTNGEASPTGAVGREHVYTCTHMIKELLRYVLGPTCF